jgi:hypothetical protein
MSTDGRRILEGQLRECYGRAVYTHKTHEKCADILLARLSKIKLWQIILASLTAAGFVGTIVESSRLLAIVGAVISTILLVLNAVVKDYDLGAVAQQHKQAANDIWLIREKYASLLSDLAIGQKTIEDGLRERDVLSLELHGIYQGAPSTTYQAYKKAQQALKYKEDMTFSDEEIDAFLPRELRRTT